MILKARESELSAILAALRYWQRCGDFAGDDIQNIATDGGRVEALDNDEIDDLCQQMNLDNMPGFEASDLTRLVGALHVEGFGDAGSEIDGSAVVDVINEHYDTLLAAAALQQRLEVTVLCIDSDNGTELNAFTSKAQAWAHLAKFCQKTDASFSLDGLDEDEIQEAVEEYFDGCSDWYTMDSHEITVPAPVPTSRPMAVVGVQGGVVQWVCADREMDVVTVDMDTEGAGAGETQTVPFMEDDRLIYDQAFAGGEIVTVAPHYTAMVGAALNFRPDQDGGVYRGEAKITTHNDAKGVYAKTFRALSLDHAHALFEAMIWACEGVKDIREIDISPAGALAQ